MPYRLSPLAEQDIEEIWFYVAQDAGPETADRLMTPSSVDSDCSSSNLAWGDIGPSSAKAFGQSGKGRPLVRPASNTTAAVS